MKHSIQKHNISNLSSLAPALRGLEDARTQRWTFCKPCSMEQNVQVYKENIVNMERPSNTFGKMRKCQSTELPRPQCWQWAWIENLMPSQIVEHSENDSWQDHWQKEKAYKHNRNGQHSEAARSMKWAVVDMFAKSESGTREICSQLEKREKHTFDFNIQYFWSRTQEIPKMSFGDLKVGIFGPSWRPRNAKE